MLLVVILAFSMVNFSGCAGKKAQKEITVFNYGMYIDPEILDSFELYSKYSSGAIKYDCVCSSEYIIMKLMAEGELQKIDFSKFEDIENISDECWQFCATFDPNNEYALPYFYGTVGLLYNTTMVSEPPTSWDVLFNGQYAGNIIMQNSVRDAFMIALKYNGYSCNETDENILAQARDLLIKQKPDVQSYFVDEVRDEMVAGHAAIGVVYSGDGLLGIEENPDLAYVIPNEGSNLWIDCWAISKNCDDPESVYLFLNYLVCNADIAYQNFEYVYYPTSNKKVIEMLDAETRADENIVPPIETLSNCEVYKLLDGRTTELLDEYWKQIKAN